MSPHPIRPRLEALDGRVLLSGLPALSVGDATVVEGNDGTSFAEVVVSLSQRSNKSVTVSYGTADGTARAGSDYTAASGKLSFAPGQTTQTIKIAVTGDRLVEPDESFVVRLSGAQNAKIADATGLVTIVDDEPRISIESAWGAVEGDSGTTLFTFTVSLSSPSDQAVTVDFATQDGSAIAGEDYVATSGTLTFAPGEMTRTITVEVVGDVTAEPDESFFMNLSGASTNAVLIVGQGYGTIVDDDGYYSYDDYSSYNYGNYYYDDYSYSYNGYYSYDYYWGDCYWY